MPANTTKLNVIEQFTVGMLVQWAWEPKGFGQIAINNGIRPLGRVVNKLTLTHMACELGIQVVDDPAWVIDPVTALSKGREFFMIKEITNEQESSAVMQLKPFLIKYSSLQKLSACLLEVCEVITEAANALDVAGNKNAKKVKTETLSKAKKSAKTQAKCNEVPESEAKAMLKVQLFQIWPVLHKLYRHMPEVTASDLELRNKVKRTADELDDSMIAATKKNEEEPGTTPS